MNACSLCSEVVRRVRRPGLFLPLFLLPACLLSQEGTRERRRPVESAIEFTNTSNSSQAGTDFVLGYRFSVPAPVILNSLGAVLRGSSAEPVFGSLPSSMPVALWDDAGNLLVSAIVSASAPLLGHFRYAPVADTLLMPGVNYTIAGLVPAGRSVPSDVFCSMSAATEPAATELAATELKGGSRRA